MANKNDDVSLDFGSDEFFPLKRTNNDKKVKAPKGASGYFKNVARSVGNLGVKIGKSLYPEAFSLSSDIKESLGESGTKLNYTDTKNKIKSTLESVKSTGKELVTLGHWVMEKSSILLTSAMISLSCGDTIWAPSSQ